MLKPTPGLAIVQAQTKDKTEGGIVLPDAVVGSTHKVIAIGESDKPVPFKVGDFVIIRKYGGSEVTYQKVDYVFVKFEDVLAIVA